MHIPWETIQLFLAIHDGGSLSEAAKALRVTQPTVSRRLAELEAEMGEPLFVRTVSGATLTSFGERLLEPARRMAEHAGEVERVAAGVDSKPRGVVRVTAPPGIAFELLVPLAAKLRVTMPEITLEVASSVSYVDLVRRDADLAIRAQKPVQRDLVCLASIEEPIAAFGSRAYRDRLGRDVAIGDVAWIGWPPSLDHLPPNPQLAARIPGFAPTFAADDFLVQLRAAELGLGALVLSVLTSRLAPEGSLVDLGLDLGKLRATQHLVCARSALATPRVRAVADLLALELRPQARTKRDAGAKKTERDHGVRAQRPR